MQKGRIWGGVKPHTPWFINEKSDSRQPIQTLSPARVYLSMQQHIGAPAQPVVAVGDAVCAGQLIGKPDGNMSAAVHASVSGTVADIRQMEIAGKPAVTIIIQSDGLNTPCTPQALAPLGEMTPENIVQALRESGVVGMGGATFPTHVKLDVKPGQIDTVLLNGSECEPLLQADAMLMQTRADAIVEGCRLVMRITGAGMAMIGIEDNKPAAIAAMREAAGGDSKITVAPMPTRYPRGGEKQLIQGLTGRQVPEGGLPSAVGVVVVNVATAAALADYLLRGQPLTHRLCTVQGDVAHPQTVRFPLGTPAGDVLAAAGGPADTPARIVQGGPMMGKTIASLSEPMLKGANGLIVYRAAHVPTEEETPCIRCNRCADACPMRLLPLFLDDAYRKENWKACVRLHATSCINCGCCTYVCPANRRLAEMITRASGQVKKMQEEAKDNAHTE